MFVKAPQGPDGVPLAVIGVEPVSIDEDNNLNGPRSYGSLPQQDFTPLVVASNYSDVDPHISEEDEIQETPRFRDLPFLILFLVHLAVMLGLAISYGDRTRLTCGKIDYNVSHWRDLIDDDDIGSEAEWKQFEDMASKVQAWAPTFVPRIFYNVILPSTLVAYAFSYLWTAVILPACPTAMVLSALLGSVAWVFLLTLGIGIGSGWNFLAMVGCAFLLWGVWYYLSMVWKLIPFAAVNLNVALKGISANCGMYMVAFIFSIVGFLWTILWLNTLVAVLDAMHQSYQVSHPRPETMSKKAYSAQEGDDTWGFYVVILFLVSLYWTCQVLLNTVQVTTAGVMATWCFLKEEAQCCCSLGVWSSLLRSLTYSLGSICFGSLLQAFISAIRTTIQAARNDREHNDDCCCSCLLCLLECLAKCLEDVLEYCNQWAFVYVGIYGYSYLESGRKVVQLFKARSFTTFVTHDLVGYVLGFSNFMVGIISGLVAMLIQIQVDKWHADEAGYSYVYGEVPAPCFVSMMLGFLVGVAVCSVITNVIRGAVNTLIVCFADDPAKLEDNHPELTIKMVHAWSAAFPDSGMNTRRAYSVEV